MSATNSKSIWKKNNNRYNYMFREKGKANMIKC